MGCILGERRNQAPLFPGYWTTIVPADHTCRAIAATVELYLSDITAMEVLELEN